MTPPSPISAPERWGLAGSLLLIVTVLFPVFDNGFVYDDDAIIEFGDYIHEPGRALEVFAHDSMYVSPTRRDADLALQTYRPMTLVSFFWDSALSGRSPWAYHLTNLLVHLLCVLLLFLLARRMLGVDRWPFALLAALWFGLSPQAGAAHIWINGRSDLFATFYALCSLIIWSRALSRPRGPSRAGLMAATSLLFLAAMLSKEVVLPAAAAIFFFPDGEGQRRGVRQRFLDTLPFAAAGLSYVALRHAVLGGLRSHEGADHILSALRLIPVVEFDGLTEALFPRRLYLRFMAHDYAAIGDAAIAGLYVGLLAAAVLAYRNRHRVPVAVWGLLWFALTLAPVAVVAGIVWPGFGRYLYLPGVGLALALADVSHRAVESRPRLRPFVVGGLALYLGLFAVLQRGRVQEFQSPDTLYGGAIAADPECPHVYAFMGYGLMRRGEFQAAVDPLARAHQLAPDRKEPLESLAAAFMQLGQYQAAHNAAVEGIERYPEAGDFHMIMVGLTSRQRPDIAAANVLECLRDEPARRDCAEALETMLTRDPRAPEYRAIVRRELERGDLSSLRERLSPILGPGDGQTPTR